MIKVSLRLILPLAANPGQMISIGVLAPLQAKTLAVSTLLHLVLTLTQGLVLNQPLVKQIKKMTREIASQLCPLLR